MLQNYARFTGDTVLGLGIPGGGTDVSTGMVLEGPGEAERRGEEEPQREGRETARETGAAAGRSVKGASSCVPMRCPVSREEPPSPVCSSHFTDGHAEHLRTLASGSALQKAPSEASGWPVSWQRRVRDSRASFPSSRLHFKNASQATSLPSCSAQVSGS